MSTHLGQRASADFSASPRSVRGLSPVQDLRSSRSRRSPSLRSRSPSLAELEEETFAAEHHAEVLRRAALAGARRPLSARRRRSPRSGGTVVGSRLVGTRLVGTRLANESQFSSFSDRPISNITREVGDGSSRAIHGAVHATHGDPTGAHRHKTYIIATYTAELEQDDIDEYFVFDPTNHDQQRAAKRFGVRLQGPTHIPGWSDLGSSPRTDASVWVELVGRISTATGHATVSTGRRLLARRGMRVGEEEGYHGAGAPLFSPGHIDEFAITCEELGDIVQCKIGHANDGHDCNTSAWKVAKVVVTCIQHSKTKEYDAWHHPRRRGAPSGGCCGSNPSRLEADRKTIEHKHGLRIDLDHNYQDRATGRYMTTASSKARNKLAKRDRIKTGKGDHAHASVKTGDSDQWHFVENGWLRATLPLLEMDVLETRIVDARRALEEWRLERRRLEVDLLHWEQKLLEVQEQAGVDAVDEDICTTISIEDAGGSTGKEKSKAKGAERTPKEPTTVL